jgi:hypothetical protein
MNDQRLAHAQPPLPFTLVDSDGQGNPAHYTASFEQKFKCILTHSKNLESEEGAPSCT